MAICVAFVAFAVTFFSNCREDSDSFLAGILILILAMAAFIGATQTSTWHTTYSKQIPVDEITEIYTEKSLFINWKNQHFEFTRYSDIEQLKNNNYKLYFQEYKPWISCFGFAWEYLVIIDNKGERIKDIQISIK